MSIEQVGGNNDIYVCDADVKMSDMPDAKNNKEWHHILDETKNSKCAPSKKYNDGSCYTLTHCAEMAKGYNKYLKESGGGKNSNKKPIVR